MAKRRNIPAAIRSRLGTMPDRVIAAECGVSIRTVGLWRESLGIPAYMPERVWTKREVRLLGTMPDAELAAKLRRTTDAVTNKRRSLNIKRPLTNSPLDVAALTHLAKSYKQE